MDIFIVEDDKKICEELSFQLELLGYKCFVPNDFSNILEEFQKRNYKLVLMDLKLPFENGFYWCEKIREMSNLPIIFLTSAADDINLINAINYGADDFISKPFSMQVLNMKIKALLRRSYDFSGKNFDLSYKNISLIKDKMVLKINDKETNLSKNEFLILEILMENPQKIVSRELIMDKLWATDSFIDDNTLTVNINRLRKKLKDFGLDDFIQTKKGVGYFIK